MNIASRRRREDPVFQSDLQETTFDQEIFKPQLYIVRGWQTHVLIVKRKRNAETETAARKNEMLHYSWP